jgi:hypothetical protein
MGFDDASQKIVCISQSIFRVFQGLRIRMNCEGGRLSMTLSTTMNVVILYVVFPSFLGNDEEAVEGDGKGNTQ